MSAVAAAGDGEGGQLEGVMGAKALFWTRVAWWLSESTYAPKFIDLHTKGVISCMLTETKVSQFGQ